jgi:hypothetical protein
MAFGRIRPPRDPQPEPQVCMCGHGSGQHGGNGCMAESPDGKGGQEQCSCTAFCKR